MAQSPDGFAVEVELEVALWRVAFHIIVNFAMEFFSRLKAEPAGHSSDPLTSATVVRRTDDNRMDHA